jgi:hypothetical protein
MKIVLREARGGRDRYRRKASILNVVESTMVRRGKEYMMCQEIAFMVLRRLKFRDFPAGPVTERSCGVRFPKLLQQASIEGAIWHFVDGILIDFIINVQEILSAPPLIFTFTVETGSSTLVLGVEDARAVDRRSQCLEATTLMLSRRVVNFPFIKRDVLGIIARMVWATRIGDCWALEPSTKKRKKGESTKYTELHMSPMEVGWNHVYSYESGSDLNDDDDEEADSFSMHSEESSEESDE